MQSNNQSQDKPQGKVVPFDPALRRGAKKGVKVSPKGFGTVKVESNPIKFKVFKIVQLVVVVVAAGFLIRSCGLF